MYEKVNPDHPDKVADRIAGAIVDLAYSIDENPKIAVEVLIGHGVCHIIAETSVDIEERAVKAIVQRIAGDNIAVDYLKVQQDVHLSDNQVNGIHCGDNGIFKGIPLTEEQKKLSQIARDIYDQFKSDGKYILAENKLTICQSKANEEDLRAKYVDATINPLGYWDGGINVDSGCTNRKLGSDMADSVTGGGIHGKDLSKADVSVNVFAFLEAQKLGKAVELHCSIGDKFVGGIPYEHIVEVARDFIMKKCGGFEKFAEWGLV